MTCLNGALPPFPIEMPPPPPPPLSEFISQQRARQLRPASRTLLKSFCTIPEACRIDSESRRHFKFCVDAIHARQSCLLTVAIGAESTEIFATGISHVVPPSQQPPSGGPMGVDFARSLYPQACVSMGSFGPGSYWHVMIFGLWILEPASWLQAEELMQLWPSPCQTFPPCTHPLTPPPSWSCRQCNICEKASVAPGVTRHAIRTFVRI